MRDRGVPASNVVLYSAEYANIVVHEFVEGERFAGGFSQLAAIAGLYSQVALIGTDHSRQLSKADYLAGITTILDEIRAIGQTGVEVDAVMHSSMIALVEAVLASLQVGLEDKKLFHIHVHDDFTEKNILLRGDQVKLLCDWDSCRQKYFDEHLACAVVRFSTERPLAGVLQQDKLHHFLRSLSPELSAYISSTEAFAALFPYLATLKHLRTYRFRNSLVHRDRADLKSSLLAWPLEHCQWLIKNRQQVSDWVYAAISSD